MIKLKVEGIDIGKRLDNFLLEKVGKDLKMTRSALVKFIQPAVLVNGKVVKKSRELDLGDYVEIDTDYIEVNVAKTSEKEVASVKGDLVILEETPQYLVLNKPKGVSVHPGKGNETNTIANYVRFYLESKGEFDKSIKRGGIIHRLDKDVSGILLCAKNRTTQLFFQKKFEDRQVIKMYLATVKPLSRMLETSEYELDGELEALIQNRFKFDEKWERIEGHITRDPKNRMRSKFNFDDIGRLAITNILPLKNNQLLINIETGRMHQIRATVAAIGWVIKGDKLYGDQESGLGIELEQILLSLKDETGKLKMWRLI